MALVQTGRTGSEREALAIKSEFSRDVERIRADSQLSDAGKEAAIARAYVTAQEALGRMQAQQEADAKRRVRALEREIFGLYGAADASESISYRDAQDRAAALPDDGEQQALRLLHQAERSGDRHLAKAIVQRALEARWAQVLNAYADEHPGSEPKLQELVDIYVGLPGSESLARLLGRAMAYELPKPAELVRFGEVRLRDLAETKF